MGAKLKVGDLVRVISPPDGNHNLVGLFGRVVEIKADKFLPIKVEFDQKILIGNGLPYDVSYWFCEEESLDNIEVGSLIDLYYNQ